MEGAERKQNMTHFHRFLPSHPLSGSSCQSALPSAPTPGGQSLAELLGDALTETGAVERHSPSFPCFLPRPSKYQMTLQLARANSASKTRSYDRKGKESEKQKKLLRIVLLVRQVTEEPSSEATSLHFTTGSLGLGSRKKRVLVHCGSRTDSKGDPRDTFRG